MRGQWPSDYRQVANKYAPRPDPPHPYNPFFLLCLWRVLVGCRLIRAILVLVVVVLVVVALMVEEVVVVMGTIFYKARQIHYTLGGQAESDAGIRYTAVSQHVQVL